jgi:hypothetical protein
MVALALHSKVSMPSHWFGQEIPDPSEKAASATKEWMDKKEIKE